MKEHLFSFFAFVETVLVIWFPNVGILGGRTFALIGLYCLFLGVILFDNGYKTLRLLNYRNNYLKVLLIYIVLIILDNLLASLVASTYFSDFKALYSLLMNMLYAYTFYHILQYDKIRKSFRSAIIVCAITLGMYSIYSYFTTTNLYTDIFYLFIDNDVAENQFNDYSATRGLSFRVYGNLNNPVFFSVELLLLIGACCYEYSKSTNKYLKLSLLTIILVLFLGIIFTGSKSGIIPAFFILAMTFYNEIGFKKMVIFLLIYLSLFSFFLPYLSSLINIDFSRFVDAMNPFASTESVGGSTAIHRSNQFSYLFEFIGSDGMFGRGYGWAKHYVSSVGIHPILHTFESLIMSAYADGGFISLLIIYPLFLYKTIKLCNTKMYRWFCYSYFFTMIVTGIGCFNIFCIMVCYLIIDTKMTQHDIINNKKRRFLCPNSETISQCI